MPHLWSDDLDDSVCPWDVAASQFREAAHTVTSERDVNGLPIPSHHLLEEGKSI